MNTIMDVFNDSDDSWYSESFGSCNGVPVNYRVMNDTEAQFHIHEEDDEIFIVLSGTLFIDLSNETINIEAGESYTVKCGISHRARVTGKVKMLVIGGGRA